MTEIPSSGKLKYGDSVINAMRLIDESGYAYGIRKIDNKPRVSAMPYTYDIAEGNISDHYAWAKIGFNAAIGVTEEEM